MPRKDQNLVGASMEPTGVVETPRLSALCQFASLPTAVIIRESAIEQLRQNYPSIDLVWLYELPLGHLERVYRRRMNDRISGSGDRVFVVEMKDDIELKLAEVTAMYASLRGGYIESFGQDAELDLASELVGAMT